MSDSVSEHRWVVDSIEEFMASIEIDGDRMLTMPQWMLPKAARQGHVLAVHHTRSEDGQRSVLTVEIDEMGTKAALRRSAAQVEKFANQPNDPGGNISF